MKKSVIREKKAPTASYQIEGTDITGTANMTFGLALSKISISTSETLEMGCDENNRAAKILCRAFANLIQLCPYTISLNGNPCGKIKPAFLGLNPALYGEIDGQHYEIRLHNGDVISVSRNEKQIAKIQKQQKTEFEKNRYDISFLHDSDLPILFLFCVLCDTIWYKNDTSYYVRKNEKTIVLFDPHKEQSQWEAD